MELRRNSILWRAFTDELEKIAAGKPPNPSQLMKMKVPVRAPSPSPTPIMSPVLPPPPGATIKTGPQLPLVQQPVPNLASGQLPPKPLLGGQTNVPPAGSPAPMSASGNMISM